MTAASGHAASWNDVMSEHAESPSEDAALRAAAGAGCERSFGELAERARPRVVRAVRRLAGDEAEDVAQNALLKAWRRRDLYDPQRPFLPWLITIARRLAIDLRRRPREAPVGDASRDYDPPSAVGATPFDAAQRREHATLLWQTAKRELTPQQHAALWLAYGEGLTPTEVAAKLNIKAGAARVLLHRARRAMAEHLADDGDDQRAASNGQGVDHD